MPFTIEIRHTLHEEITRRLIGQFDYDNWNSLWTDLSVTEQQIDGWRAALQAGHWEISLIPEFPQISRLFSIDEGKVTFGEARIPQLRDECGRLDGVVNTDLSRRLIGLLQEACAQALPQGGEIVVHPFGWVGRGRQEARQ